MVFIDIGFHRLTFVLRQNIVQYQACHLVRCLSSRRHKTALRTRAGSTVADGENVRIACGLQGRLGHQLVNTVRFQPANLFHKIRRFDASSPDHQVCFDVLAIFGMQAAVVRAGHHGLGQNPHAQLGQFIMRRTGNARRQRRQDTFTRFNQRHVQRVIG